MPRYSGRHYHGIGAGHRAVSMPNALLSSNLASKIDEKAIDILFRRIFNPWAFLRGSFPGGRFRMVSGTFKLRFMLIHCIRIVFLRMHVHIRAITVCDIKAFSGF